MSMAGPTIMNLFLYKRLSLNLVSKDGYMSIEAFLKFLV